MNYKFQIKNIYFKMKILKKKKMNQNIFQKNYLIYNNQNKKKKKLIKINKT